MFLKIKEIKNKINAEVQLVNTRVGDYIKAPGLLVSNYYVLALYDKDESVWQNTLEQYADDLCNFTYSVLSSNEFPEYYLYKVKIRTKYEKVFEAALSRYMTRLEVIDPAYAKYSKKFWGHIFEEADRLMAAGAAIQEKN